MVYVYHGSSYTVYTIHVYESYRAAAVVYHGRLVSYNIQFLVVQASRWFGPRGKIRELEIHSARHSLGLRAHAVESTSILQ